MQFIDTKISADDVLALMYLDADFMKDMFQKIAQGSEKRASTTIKLKTDTWGP